MLTVAAAFILFAILHSLTVSRWFKSVVARNIGEAWMRAYYRLVFTLFSAAITVWAAYVIHTAPDTLVLFPPLYLALAGRVIQAAGIVIFIAAFRPFDFGFFTGVRQAAGSRRRSTKRR